ncbi:MAG: hypothetical protein HQM10_21940 [Candidatus Riflebacteria bacterium]|nr:hypothetical protein [Candidatus Riflebacteria bacterium]
MNLEKCVLLRHSTMNNRGMAFIYSLAAGFVLLFLASVIFSLVVSHHKEIQLSKASISARFISECGIGLTVRAFRESVNNSDQSLVNLLMGTSSFGKVPFDPTNSEKWKYNIASIKTIDPDASLKISAVLRNFVFIEKDSSMWNDPVAKRGILEIKSTGTVGTISHEISCERIVSVVSSIPPLASKFSLKLNNPLQRESGRFNVIENIENGIPTGEYKPLILLNHICPDNPVTFETTSSTPGKDAWKSRGWVYMKNDTYLQISSGNTENGEAFILHKKFDKEYGPVEYVLATITSDIIQSGTFTTASSAQQINYSFSPSYTFFGFDSALYKDNETYLKSVDTKKYPPKSSFLRLFGEPQETRQSNTKVLGRVFAGFPRFSRLHASPVSGGQVFCFFLPYYLQTEYDMNMQLSDPDPATDYPVMKYSDVFPGGYSAYSRQMCMIFEFPYSELYNMVAEGTPKAGKPTFPPEQILSYDEGNNIELKRESDIIYQGSAANQAPNTILDQRIQQNLISCDQFWKKYSKFDGTNFRLYLNSVVRITNPASEDFCIPPNSSTLYIDGGGIIILDKGNVVVNGVKLQESKPFESLTVIAREARNITLEKNDFQHLNIIAPKADLKSFGKMNLYGFLEIGDIKPENAKEGGYIRFRETLDPTSASYKNFYKICISEDSNGWLD